MTARECARAHPMRVISRFRFDHEASDAAQDSLALRRFKQLGFELGAAVTVWYCRLCDTAEAEFRYPERDARAKGEDA